MGVAVSGKNFKRAVDRNRVKRLTREAYRVQKNELKDLVLQQKKTLILFLIFTAKDLPEWAMVSAKVGVILKKMCGLLNEAIPPPVK